MRTSGGLYHRMIIDVMCEHDLIDYLNLVFDQDEEFSKPRLTRYYGVRKFDLLVKSHAAIISFALGRVCLSGRPAGNTAMEASDDPVRRSSASIQMGWLDWA